MNTGAQFKHVFLELNYTASYSLFLNDAAMFANSQKLSYPQFSQKLLRISSITGCLTIQENEFPVDFQEEFQDITTALRPSVYDKLKKQVMIGSSLRLP
jgi:hypothetical protein